MLDWKQILLQHSKNREKWKKGRKEHYADGNNDDGGGWLACGSQINVLPALTLIDEINLFQSFQKLTCIEFDCWVFKSGFNDARGSVIEFFTVTATAGPTFWGFGVYCVGNVLIPACKTGCNVHKKREYFVRESTRREIAFDEIDD